MTTRLSCADPGVAELLVPCWEEALDVVERNTAPEGFLRAGGGYPTPWTRDAAVNAWFAGSWLVPETARTTLLAVTDVTDGVRHVQRDNQWWDKVVWVVGAWHHAQVTDNREFLRTAFEVASGLMEEMSPRLVDGLYRGPSFFNDGISGYPAPPAQPDDGGSSFVLDHAGTDELAALSTNCLYVGARRALTAMASALGEPDGWPVKDLVDAIRTRLLPSYLLLPDGTVDRTQEASGLAFAVLFGVVDAAEGRQLLRSATRLPHGVPSTWPHFDRYDDSRPGRHNAVVWPVVQGLWARAADTCGATEVAVAETDALARLCLDSGGFYEIYDGQTGAINGGWQSNRHWRSEPDQTWSATAFLGMVLHGVMGLRPGTEASSWGAPGPWGDCTITDLPWRGGTVDLRRRSGKVELS